MASRRVSRPDGTTRTEPRIDVRHVAEAVLYMAGLSARRQCPVHYLDGHHDALHRPRLNRRFGDEISHVLGEAHARLCDRRLEDRWLCPPQEPYCRTACILD